jgi:hypothetical protein
VPKHGVVMSDAKFQSIVSDLKSKGETVFREKLMMAKKPMKYNADQCILTYENF